MDADRDNSTTSVPAPVEDCPWRHHRTLLGIPVYNEQQHVSRVLEAVQQYACDVLVIDDGSTDQTPMLLAEHPVEVIRHAENRGYGRSMQDMIRWAKFDGYDWLITMDCDEQHEPTMIPEFMNAIARDDADVISGSRYLNPTPLDDAPPQDRRTINRTITREVNRRLGLSLTDAFCGFKAYRVEPCSRLELDVDGYDFPMQFWVQAVAHNLRIVELPVRLIYNDPNRSFGGPLDNPESRLAIYRTTLHDEICKVRDRLPRQALEDVSCDDSTEDGTAKTATTTDGRAAASESAEVHVTDHARHPASRTSSSGG